jgi:hypothetical protein
MPKLISGLILLLVLLTAFVVFVEVRETFEGEGTKYELAATAVAEASKKASEAVELIRELGKEMANRDLSTGCPSNANTDQPSLDEMLAEAEAEQEAALAKGPILTTTVSDLIPKITTSSAI